MPLLDLCGEGVAHPVPRKIKWAEFTSMVDVDDVTSVTSSVTKDSLSSSSHEESTRSISLLSTVFFCCIPSHPLQ
eukprot:scaffold10020_cov161-Skeletonema_marinoi.AAC.20